MDEPTPLIDVSGLAHLVDGEFKRIGWTNREAAELSRQYAEKHGYTRKWGKGTVAGISYSAWHGMRSGTAGVPDLEVLALAALTLREHGSTITLEQMLEAMGLEMRGGTRQTRARAKLGALPDQIIEEVVEIAELPPAKYRVIRALLVALRQMDDEDDS